MAGCLPVPSMHTGASDRDDDVFPFVSSTNGE
jgi:hypothetical protein